MVNHLVWFKNDLRLSDNPALSAASHDASVVPIFILDSKDMRPIGEASKVWLHYSLLALNKSLGGNLIIRTGQPLEIILSVIKEYCVSLYEDLCFLRNCLFLFGLVVCYKTLCFLYKHICVVYV